MDVPLKASIAWMLALTILQLTSAQTKVIESFHVKTDIRFRFATTQMVSVVRNEADEAQQISFDVTLPKEAFIVNFSMAIDGKEYIGEVKEKNAAKRQYQSAVDRGQSAGHIRQAPRHANVFEVSVNVANGSAVTFTLTYQELLRRKLGIYEHEIHVNPGQAVDDFSIEIFIQENREIPFVRTPALRTDVLLTNNVEMDNNLAFIERPTPETAHIKYSPTLQQQGENGVCARFAMQYDVDHSDKGEVLVVDGYFLHFYAPPDAPPLPKDIIFVLDVSGSMYGQKMKQLIDSMVTMLKDLKPEDRFNILTFSTMVTSWRPNLAVADSNVIQEAIGFVKEMQANGGTNINAALLKGLEELNGRERSLRVGMIFFLTDGQATAGVTNTDRIASNVLNANQKEAAIFALAYGKNANFNSLKTISTQNNGFARKIYEASDSSLQVASLYEEISAVAMQNVKVEYLPGVKNTTNTDIPLVFNGTEIVICGPFIRHSFLETSDSPFVKISGVDASGEVDIVLDIDDVTDMTITLDDNDSLNKLFTMPRDYTRIVEKMWAFLTIKQLLKDKERLVQDEKKAEELKTRILEMSLKYNFVTPLTSMVVTKPGEENEEEKFESGLEDVDDLSDIPNPPMHSYSMGGSFSQSQSRANYSPGFASPGRHSGMRRNKIQQSRRKFHSFPQAIRPGGFATPISPHFFTQAVPTTTTTTTTKTTTTTTTRATTMTTESPTKSTGKINNKRKAKARFAILSSLVIRSANSSVCVSPRYLKAAKYNLLQGRDGRLKIDIITDCLKRCRIALADSLNLTDHNGDKVVIQLSSLDRWRYSQGQNVTVYLVGQNKLEFKTDVVDVIITRNQSKKRILYDIEFVLKTEEVFSGLLDGMQRRATKMRSRKRKMSSKKRKIPKACRKSQADASLNLNTLNAKRYLQQPSP